MATMTAHPFTIQMISSRGKETRSVIACNSIQAVRTALATFTEPDSPFALTCHRLAALPTMEEPCATSSARAAS